VIVSDTTTPNRDRDYPGDWFIVRRSFRDMRPVVVTLDIRRRAQQRATWDANATKVD